MSDNLSIAVHAFASRKFLATKVSGLKIIVDVLTSEKWYTPSPPPAPPSNYV